MKINSLIHETSELEKLDILLQVTTMKSLEVGEYVSKEAQLSHIVTQTNDIFSSVKNAIMIIEKEVPKLKGLLNFFDYFNNKEKQLLNFLFEIARIKVEKLMQVITVSVSNLSGRDAGELVTTNSINELLIRLLQLKSGSLYDGTVGLGGTLLTAIKNNDSIDLYGEDINEVVVRMTKLRLFIEQGHTGDIQVANTLTSPSFIEKGKLKQFDYVAMHAPFGLKIPSTEPFERDEFHRYVYGPLTKRNVDLAFLMHGIASIKETGKGAFLMMGSPLMRGGADMTIRQNLITADLIEAVIALPEKMLTNTQIPTYIVIVNKNKHAHIQGKIMFINAANNCEKTRSMNYLSEEQLNNIVHTYENKLETEDYSTVLEANELEDNILLPEKYIVEKMIEDDVFGRVHIKHNKLNTDKNVVKLEDCVTEMYRGLNITASTVKEGEGPLQIIQLSNVENGIIQLNQLTRGTLVRDSNLERYTVKKGDVIVSNRGTHIKIAVVPEVDENIILSHNFIGLRLKENIDPYYLKMYLESPIGQFELAQQQVGSRILSISPTNMKKINVMLSTDKSIGKQYDDVFKKYEKQLKQIEEERDETIKTIYEQSGLFNFMTLDQ